jgi:ferritin-like metal-binding protein YciE
MTHANQKIVQYLNEAHAHETGLVRVLQEQIAMTPRGSYRDALELHLRETRQHASRVQGRLRELGEGGSLLQAGIGLAESVVAQGLALGKAPFDLLRGTGGEEKVLKNAKDAAATEALEIATYTSLERLANALGDTETARLAVSLRRDEERMLERILREIPELTDAVVGADVHGAGSYDVTETGAADAARSAARTTQATARQATRRTRGAAESAERTARRTTRTAAGEVARQTRRATAGTQAGSAPGEQDLPIAGYAGLNVGQVTGRLSDLSQAELAAIAAYEREHDNRTTVLARIDALRADEPWSGYDAQTVAEIRRRLDSASPAEVKAAREYERAHKNRAGVIEAAERETATTA